MDKFLKQNTSAFIKEALKLSTTLNQRFKEVPSLSEQDIFNYFMFDHNQQNFSKVLKLALDYDIDLTNYGIYLPLKILKENKDIFLNHHNPMKTELFFYLAIAQNYSTEEEYKTQSEFLKLALDSNLDINTLLSDISNELYYQYKLEFLTRNQDILLNHPTNPVNKEWFFKEAFSRSAYNEKEYQIQADFVKLALDHGMDITKINELYLSLEFLTRNQDILLNHPTNPVNKEWFFKEVLSYSPYNDEFVKLTLDHGINITKVKSYFDLDFLSRHQDILLNHPTNPVNKEWFFKEAFSRSAYNEKDYKIQADFVKLVLDHGINITKVKSYFDLEFLSRNQDILLNHPTNPVNKEWFFKEAFSRSAYNEKEYQIQADFVKLALDHGMDITKINELYLSLEFLTRNQDILLNHPTNSMKKDEFFKKAFSSLPFNDNEQQMHSNLAKLALDNGFDFSSIPDHRLDLDFFYNNKELLLNHSHHPMKKEVFFNLALSASISRGSESKQSELLKLAINSNVNVFDLEKIGYNLGIDSIMENYDLLLNHCSNKEQLDKFLNLVLSYNITDKVYLAKQTETLKLALDSGINFNKVSYLSLTLLAENKNLLLNHPTNPVHPDLILKYILQSSPYSKGFDKDLQYEIAKELIELGANVDQEIEGMMGTASILGTINDPDLYNLLKEHGATCGKASINYEKYLKQHLQLEAFLDNQSEYFSQTDDNSHALTEYANKIPHSINHVWLTHAEKPREISDADIENVILTKNTFGGNLSKWQHIIWTNNKNLIPKSVKILEENGIEVRDINECQDQLKLYNTVTALADKKLWGMASDALRYEIIAKFGGIYADLNYQFIRSIENETYKYDFLAQDFINYFFAAKPNHPILNDLVKTMHDHFNNNPEYLTNFSEKHIFDKTVLFSLLPFTTAIIENYNKDVNVDMVVGLSHRLEFNETCSIYGYYDNHSYEESNSYYPQFTNNCPTYWKALKLGFSPSFESESLRIGKDGYKDAHLTWIEEGNSNSEQNYLGNSPEYYYSNIA